MTERRIVVISAGLGVPSSSRMLADQLATATVARLREQGTAARADVIELRELAVDIANNLVTGYAAPKLADVIDQVVQADALIAVTPVFTASYSGLFKSFFDLIDTTALDGKPVLIAATGGSARHSMVLDFAVRPMFSYLRARVAPTAVYASPDDWGAAEEGLGRLDERVARAAGELAAMVQENRPVRQVGQMESLPFEQLLAQISPK